VEPDLKPETSNLKPDMFARLARLRVPLGFVFGVVSLWLARPTASSVMAGALVAIVGESIRVWAAGHLEKGREVTSSGPYRWSGHPLYIGSSVMGVGLALGASRLEVTVLVAAYLIITQSRRFGPRRRSWRPPSVTSMHGIARGARGARRVRRGHFRGHACGPTGSIARCSGSRGSSPRWRSRPGGGEPGSRGNNA
jgi:hypothetical protein